MTRRQATSVATNPDPAGIAAREQYLRGLREFDDKIRGQHPVVQIAMPNLREHIVRAIVLESR